MYELIKSETFSKWLMKFKDQKAKQRVLARLKKIEEGHLGYSKKLEDKISELKFDFGPGYRIYFSVRNDTIVLLLCAGDKGSQKRDIKKARNILNEWESQNE